MPRTLVLGSGLSALVYLHYDDLALALAGPQVGGQAARSGELGPQLVWDDPLARELLSSLGLPLVPQRVQVGYHDPAGGGVVPQPPGKFREAYALKTRGQAPRASYLSGGRSSFTVLQVTMAQLAAELRRRVELRLLLTAAEAVNPWERWVLGGDGQRYHFDTLVATIPAPKLLKLLGRADAAEQLKARDKGYETWKLHQLPSWAQAAKLFDYVYVADPAVPYHRVKFNPGGETAVVEYTARDGEKLAVNGVLHPQGQIISGGEVLSSLPPWIRTLGRYAQWDHGVKLNEVLARARSWLP